LRLMSFFPFFAIGGRTFFLRWNCCRPPGSLCGFRSVFPLPLAGSCLSCSRGITSPFLKKHMKVLVSFLDGQHAPQMSACSAQRLGAFSPYTLSQEYSSFSFHDPQSWPASRFSATGVVKSPGRESRRFILTPLLSIRLSHHRRLSTSYHMTLEDDADSPSPLPFFRKAGNNGSSAFPLPPHSRPLIRTDLFSFPLSDGSATPSCTRSSCRFCDFFFVCSPFSSGGDFVCVVTYLKEFLCDARRNELA